MSSFYTAKYRIKTAGGFKEVSKDFFLPNAAAVREEIFRSGGSVLAIREKNPKWWEREFISSGYKLGFLRSLAFHVQTGMSPGRALWLVIEGETDSKKRYELEPGLEVLRRGGGFITALQALRMFDRATLSIISAGERIGELREVLTSAIAHLEEKGKTWKLMIAALGWLWFDIATSFSTVLGVQYGYLPWLEKNGIDTKDEALRQEFFNAISSAYIINGFLIGIAVLIAVVGVVVMGSLLNRKGGQLEEFTSKVINHLPFVKGFLENTALAETFSITGRMIKGRVKLDEVIKVATESTPYAPVRNLWDRAGKRIVRGDTVDRAMRSPILTRVEILQIAAHQNVDQLAMMFLYIAEERGNASKRNLRQIVVGGVAFTIFYTFLAAGTAMWVLWVQNKGVTATLDNISTSF